MKIISFDLDGTLVKTDFVDAVWLNEIPRLYAEKHGMDIEEAKKFVEKEYLKIGPESIEWYDINYWLNKFEIDTEYIEIFQKCKNKLSLYDDVIPALKNLDGKHLIIISNAASEFIKFEIEELGIGEYFREIFSAVSHFNKTKKDGKVYKKVCEKLNIGCKHLIHVGDNYEFDYIAPREAGAAAFYLDRHGYEKGRNIVYSLEEFVEAIS